MPITATQLNRFPSAWRTKTRLDIFNVRNQPPQLDQQQIRNHLQTTELTIDHGPEQFVAGLSQLENVIGTAYATLAGMVIASDYYEEPSSIVEAIDVFDRVRARISGTIPLSFSNYYETDVVYQYLRARLTLGEFQNDMVFGLNALEENLERVGETVGSCMICSGIFALLAMSQGHLAGEGRQFHKMHDVTVLPGATVYEKTGFGSDLYTMTDPERYFISHPFSFISSLLLYRAYATMLFSEVARPTGEMLEIALNKVEVAEAISPFYVRIYDLKARIFKMMGEDEKRRVNFGYENVIKYYLQNPIIDPFWLRV